MAKRRRREVTMQARSKQMSPPAPPKIAPPPPPPPSASPESSRLLVPQSIFNKTGENPTEQLNSLPSHVLDAVRREKISFAASKSPVSYYRPPMLFESPQIEIGFTSTTFVQDDSLWGPKFGQHPTIYHEVGHAINDVLPRSLSSASPRFLNLCRKHRAGTPGGGGGLGEFTKDYAKSSCEELYADGFAVFYATPLALREYDPQMYQFFLVVDAELRRRARR